MSLYNLIVVISIITTSEILEGISWWFQTLAVARIWSVHNSLQLCIRLIRWSEKTVVYGIIWLLQRSLTSCCLIKQISGGEWENPCWNSPLSVTKTPKVSDWNRPLFGNKRLFETQKKTLQPDDASSVGVERAGFYPPAALHSERLGYPWQMYGWWELTGLRKLLGHLCHMLTTSFTILGARGFLPSVDCW